MKVPVSNHSQIFSLALQISFFQVGLLHPGQNSTKKTNSLGHRFLIKGSIISTAKSDKQC
jgi:hypothetical protein